VCKLQEYEEEHINHHHHLYRWAKPTHPHLVLMFGHLCCCIVFAIIVAPP
jgi:hypothetical protein